MPGFDDSHSEHQATFLLALGSFGGVDVRHKDRRVLHPAGARKGERHERVRRGAGAVGFEGLP